MVEEVRLVHCMLLTTEAGDSCGEAVLVSMSRVGPMAVVLDTGVVVAVTLASDSVVSRKVSVVRSDKVAIDSSWDEAGRDTVEATLRYLQPIILEA